MTDMIPVLLLLIGPVVQSGDTVLSVREGMRLDLRNNAGAIRVTTWNRDEVELRTGQPDGVAFSVGRSGDVLRVRPRAGRWRRSDGRRSRREWDVDPDRPIEVSIRMPAYLHLALRGIETDIEIEGSRAGITAATVEGSIDVTGGMGIIALRTQEDPIRLTGARGQVEISSGEGGVFLRDVTGDISIDAIDGDIELQGIVSARCEARTIDGDVTYRGTLQDDGRYQFSTHDGDVTLIVRPDANAAVAVTNYDGAFETEFPILMRGSRKKQFQFVLGSGRAQVELSTFDGDIFLRRAR